LKHASKQLAQEHSKYLELQSDLEEKDGLIKRLHAAQFAHKTKIRKLESQVVDVMKAASGEGGAASEAVMAQYEKARLSVVGLEEALERQREEYELLLGEARGEARRDERATEAEGKLVVLRAEMADKDAEASTPLTPRGTR